ncbi:MAG: putative ATPase [Chloroflexi bacterium]|jgi:putative ATPase|nr:MAG: putative ATPase [Chloroflexota bacterium]
MTLFEHHRQSIQNLNAPLAARMRPRNFDELVGQEHLVGTEAVLRQSIESDQIPSMILWGPPGSGKTTLASLISSVTKSHFEQVSAVTSGVSDLRRIFQEARDRLGMSEQRTIFFVDEIHRFNKAQQDVILPHVEDGTVTFIGATTENPSFEIISPLLSRSRIFTTHPLAEDEIALIIERALKDSDRGLGHMNVSVDPKALTLLLAISNGDSRAALNTIELAASASEQTEKGAHCITLPVMEGALQRRALSYDKKGDQHYDTISAFIKSVRASDPDAAIYWLGRMIEAGEDSLFISRRMVILAAEDIGLADPQALTIAVAAQQAVHFIGMPEGRIPMAEAAIYLATAPKSNAAYTAINKVLEDVKTNRVDPVPLHLRNPVNSTMQKMGYGKGYQYPHQLNDHFAGQDNLPDNLKGKTYYHPSNQGYEKTVAERLNRWWGDKHNKNEERGSNKS